MFSAVLKTILCVFIFAALFSAAAAQSETSARVPGHRDDRPRDEPKSFSEMMAKHRIEQAKKDYEEMLDRAGEALRISQQIETSFDKAGSITRQDRQKLDELEKVVVRIRKELGGGEDSEDGGVDEDKPSTVKEAVRYLQSTASNLVDQLKKSTRFTISAAAIQSSNNLIRIARFLPLRK
jgi:hypothetical protein